IGTASAIADAATRSAIDGTDFGDNVLAILPSVIGQTIGKAIAGGVSKSIESAKGGEDREIDYLNDDLETIFPSLDRLRKLAGLSDSTSLGTESGLFSLSADFWDLVDPVSLPAFDVAQTAILASDAASGVFGAGSASRAEFLTSGALRIFGTLVTAEHFLRYSVAQAERAQVEQAIEDFGLDSSQTSHVMAANAYVWAQYQLPLHSSANFYGGDLNAASEAIMRLELVNPGLTAIASNRAFIGTEDQRQARIIIRMAAEAAIADYNLESRSRRPSGVDRHLQTTSASARAALSLRTGDDMRAHHLVPANVWGQTPILAQSAYEAGWRVDSIMNLIALPANEIAQQRIGNTLPIHNTQHPDYDTQTRVQIATLRATIGGRAPTPLEARGIFETVALVNRLQIVSRIWHPRMH
ncbi:AHH domain-containing protein, partial [Maricaulis sp. D1M11]|uniref:AHH domain-containing protein n=1 Tax=Maricaulis sp. D1M11 TaxID=3076117 RepID=UPI0039B3FC19